ncbi:MAG: potassium-transporting ATPase subunit C [Candidatus Bathyarchaeia archaeon]
MTSKMNENEKSDYRPVIRLALISLVICGLLFPLIVTGLAQALFPYQANGEIMQLGQRSVGSVLIAQNFTSPTFFHPRGGSASGVDPDITLQDAYSQMPRIQEATGISGDLLINIVNKNEEGVFWVFGSPYVNVLRINLALVKAYPNIYNRFG